MSNLNFIGLDKGKSEEIAGQLNALLADYSIFYQNLRGFHWNVKGDKFFKLHEKFEELYNEMIEKIDEIAERILTLGYSPEHNYSNYLNTATIKESKNLKDGDKMVENILETFGIIISKQRTVLSLAGDAGDEGTVALMSDYISGQEKTVWMLAAFLGK